MLTTEQTEKNARRRRSSNDVRRQGCCERAMLEDEVTQEAWTVVAIENMMRRSQLEVEDEQSRLRSVRRDSQLR
jgi:hypothetical protein